MPSPPLEVFQKFIQIWGQNRPNLYRYLSCIVFTGLELQPISATLSSSYGHYGPGYCIDGNTGGTFCHTDHDAKPWIAIDYGYGVIVERVEIFNRANCCGFRTRNVDVRISYQLPTSGDEMFSGGTLLGHFAGPGSDGQQITISGQNML